MISRACNKGSGVTVDGIKMTFIEIDGWNRDLQDYLRILIQHKRQLAPHQTHLLQKKKSNNVVNIVYTICKMLSTSPFGFNTISIEYKFEMCGLA